MAPSLAWYDVTDSTVETSVSLSVTPGTPSSGLELHLWNWKGAGSGDSANNLRLLVGVRNPGENYFVTSGRPPVDGRWIRAQIVGAEGNAQAVATGWVALGTNASL